jgi:DNA-binding response OmpR family regulator
MQPPEQPTTEASCIPLGDLTIDLDSYVIHYPDGSDSTLTLRERDLLQVLLHSRGRVLSYADLGLYAWHYPDRYYSPHGIRNCIWRLRRKLGQAAAAIQAVRGIGYRFQARPTAPRKRPRRMPRRRSA